MRPRATFTFVLPCLWACAGGAPDRDGFVRRDSAGVVIAESARPAWTGAPAWELLPEPDLRIGTIDGDDAYLLQRVAGAVRLSDGMVVVLNGGTQELRFYDADGRHLRTAGGQGGGPGEYQGAHRLFRMAGDSIFVADVIGARFSVVDRDGRFIRSYTADWRRASPAGRLADGRLVSASYADQQLAVQAGYVRVPVHLRVWTPDGTREDTVALLRGGEEYRIELDDGAAIANYAVPFGRSQQIFVGPDRIYTGTGDDFEIEVRRADGTLEQLVRPAVEPRRVTPADVEGWRQSQLERASPRARPAIERFVRAAPVHSTMPAYSALHVDTEGRIWAQEYAPAGVTPPRWHIFEPDGRWLGAIELPDRFQVTEIGADYVLGIHRDDLDVESVRLYRIDRDGSGSDLPAGGSDG